MDIETAYKFYSDSSKLPYNVGRITCVQRDRCSLESIDGTVYASCSKKAMRDTAPAIGDWCIFEKNGVQHQVVDLDGRRDVLRLLRAVAGD